MMSKISATATAYDSKAEKIVLIFLALICLGVHSWLAWIGTIQGNSAWAFALIEGSNLLGIDDSYRFFLSFYAFKEVEIYSWDYVLPVTTLFFGSLTSLVNDSILAGRLVVLLLTIIGYYALYRSTRLAGGRQWAAITSLLILAFMPVQSAMSISYYGEALLVVAISLVMHCYAKKQWLACSFIASLLPLIRPEGIFILAPFSVFFFLRRQYTAFLLSGLAGFLFYLFISFQSGDLGLSLLLDWRLELRSIWKTFIMPNTYNNLGMFSTYNLLWIIGAHAGFLSPSLRKHWPLWVGSILWSLFYTALVVTGMSSYESRYFVACFPSFVMGFALFLQYLSSLPKKTFKHWQSVGLLIASFIFIEHFFQYDPIKARLGSGKRWPVNQVPVIHSDFIYYSPEQMKSLRSMGATINNLVREHPEIDTLLVFEWPVLYFLGREFLESGVRVQFSPIPKEVTNVATGGSFFTYSQYGKKFSYYNLTDVRSKNIDGVALYVGRLGSPNMDPTYDFSPYQFSVVGYNIYSSPNWHYQGKIHIK